MFSHWSIWSLFCFFLQVGFGELPFNRIDNFPDYADICFRVESFNFLCHKVCIVCYYREHGTLDMTHHIINWLFPLLTYMSVSRLFSVDVVTISKPCWRTTSVREKWCNPSPAPQFSHSTTSPTTSLSASFTTSTAMTQTLVGLHNHKALPRSDINYCLVAFRVYHAEYVWLWCPSCVCVCPADYRECVWCAVCGWHVPAPGPEAPVWEDPGPDTVWGQRSVHMENSQALPPVPSGGPVYRIHGQDHRKGQWVFVTTL